MKDEGGCLKSRSSDLEMPLLRALKCEHPHVLAGSLGHYCPLASILWYPALVTDNDVH